MNREALNRHLNALVEASSPDEREDLEARLRSAERRATYAEERMFRLQQELARAQAEETCWKSAAQSAFKREDALREQVDRLRSPWWQRLFRAIQAGFSA